VYGLELEGLGRHGFGLYEVEGWHIHHCDIHHIGGAILSGTTRYGNGIEFYNNAENCLVEHNRIWEVFDAALSNQGDGTNLTQRDIIYKHNKIWNSEYSFELWLRNSTSVLDNVSFLDNVCMNAGYGWGHSVRPDPNGAHLMISYTSATATNINI
jgi:hypothetical protein